MTDNNLPGVFYEFKVGYMMHIGESNIYSEWMELSANKHGYVNIIAENAKDY